MDPIRWKSRPQLRDPVLVCAFNGWNDAGEAASAALGLILGDFGGNEVADIDPEEFFDFTAVRPTIRLVEGRTRVIEWPSNTFHAAHVPAAERDLLLMSGTEPSLRWRAFNEAIIHVAEEMGVELVVTLGALLADVPHTRPVGVTGFASDESLIGHLGFQRSSYEGPTGVVGALHHACQQHGMPSASLWASVPHYVAAAPEPEGGARADPRLRGAGRPGGRRRAARGGRRRVRAPGQRRRRQRPRREGVRRAARGADGRRPGRRAARPPAVGGLDRARLPALPEAARPRVIAPRHPCPRPPTSQPRGR